MATITGALLVSVCYSNIFTTDNTMSACLRPTDTPSNIYLTTPPSISCQPRNENIVRGWFHIAFNWRSHPNTYMSKYQSMEAHTWWSDSRWRRDASVDCSLFSVRHQIHGLSHRPSACPNAAINRANGVESALVHADRNYDPPINPDAEHWITSLSNASVDHYNSKSFINNSIFILSDLRSIL